MKHTAQMLTAALLAGLLLCTPLSVSAEEDMPQTAASAASPDLSPEAVYNALIACKEQYPEGMTWTNDNYYRWDAAHINGYGCVAFAGILSDAAFGDLPLRYYYDYTQIRVGDILRIAGDAHSVVILEIYDDYITVAEGNYGGKVHWGRKMQMSEVLSDYVNYAITRYPETPDEPPAADLSGDGELTVADAVLLMHILAEDTGLTVTAEQLDAADLNGDDMLTVADYSAICALLL